jgi:hypothetical protein
MGFIVGRLADQVQALDQTIRKSGITPRYGLVLFVDDVIVAQQGSAFSSLDALERELDRWSRFAATNRQLTIDAPNLDWPENGLDALFHAATQFHWRQLQDTGRLIVFASDDTFGVPGDSLSSVVRVEHGYAEVMDTLVANDIHVASFTSKIGGRCECLDVTPGWLTPYRNMQSIPLGSGGAAFDIDDVAGEFLSFGQALGPLIEGTACDDRPAEAPSRHDGPA